MTHTIKKGIYKHRNGNSYQVIGMGRGTYDLKEYVVYQALYGDFGIWIRPYEEFVAEVDGVPRFVFVNESMVQAPAYEKR